MQSLALRLDFYVHQLRIWHGRLANRRCCCCCCKADDTPTSRSTGGSNQKTTVYRWFGLML